MRSLELFSGTGSIGEAFGKEAWEVVSLDVSKTGGATICCDIMVWDFKVYPRGHFDGEPRLYPLQLCPNKGGDT